MKASRTVTTLNVDLRTARSKKIFKSKKAIVYREG